MKNIRRYLACLAAGGLCATAAAQTVEWVREYNGPASEFDGAWAITVDAAGNVYVAGGSESATNSEDYTIVKYAPDGTPSDTWPDVGSGAGVRRYDFVNNFDRANAIAVDESGNVYVTGQFINEAGCCNYDFGTLKYDAAGSFQWVATHNGPASQWDEAHNIALDGLGHVYVTGKVVVSPMDKTDYSTIKYDAATGQPSASWPDVGFGVGVRRYNSPQSWGFGDTPLAMVADRSGNVYVTGGAEGDIATVRYDAAGNEVWAVRHDSGNFNDAGGDIALDETGAVYVTGSLNLAGTYYVTLKYDADGTLSADWPDVGFGEGVRVYHGPGTGWDSASAIALDGSGRVYVTGRSWGVGTGIDYATIKYDPDGSPSSTWPDVGFGVGVRRYSTAGEFDDKADHIAVDLAGNVYVAGTVDCDAGCAQWTIVKYSPSGAESWVGTYNSPGLDQDYLTGLVVDDSRNIYATGFGLGKGTNFDYVTIKYSQPAGCTWDLNSSGDVGILDLLALLAAWGSDPGGPPDFDGDGVVGILDLLTLLANWGPCL
ncbi:MAG: hypothetical protein IH983_08905 [Planctomycetes bacterium]|nr:hypothetical protein [Planctomycetota bacterium]